MGDTEELQQCEKCAVWFQELVVGGELCQDCTPMPSDINLCIWCGEERVECEDDMCPQCENDTGECEDCGERDWLRNLNTVNSGDVCEGCYQYYGSCVHCSDTLHENQLYYCEGEDDSHCEDCSTTCYVVEERVNYNGLHDYGYRPSFTFFGNPPDSLHLGVELEIDCGDIEVVGAFQGVAGYEDVFYLKEDGSLGRDGVEIVTHPASLAAHLDGTVPWAELVTLAKQYGYTSHEAQTCGLHVHLSRAGLGTTTTERDATLSNMILFVWRHWDNVRKLSRRTDGQMMWCRPNHNAVQDFEPSKVEDVKNVGRHVVLNNTNSDTIELRLFRGTLNLSTLFATLQFAHHLVTYCRGKEAIDVVTGSWASFTTDLPQELLTYLEVRQC